MASKQTQQTQLQQQQQLAKQKEAEAEKIKEYIAKWVPFPLPPSCIVDVLSTLLQYPLF